MKRMGNLYQCVYEPENIWLAHKRARKGKSHYLEVKQIDRNPEKPLKKISEMLEQKTYRTSSYVNFNTQCSGKMRKISKLPYYPDRIVHHAVMQVVGPIWTRTLIADTYACIPGRGIHKGAKRIRAALNDNENTRYCFKCDVEKFYPSVNHEILKAIIRRKIKDPDLLWLLDEVIDSAPGIPIGNYLSQHFGNLYLSEVDHWAKEKLRCRYYFRYCDDLVVLHRDKNFLHELRIRLQGYLRDKLDLRLKGNWQVFPVADRGIDFLGYRFFPGYTLARKRIVNKFKRKIKIIKKHGPAMRPLEVVSGLTSYYGWFKHANCHHLIGTYLDEEVCGIAAEACRDEGISVPRPLEHAA